MAEPVLPMEANALALWRSSLFTSLETKAPKLVAAMRLDLQGSPSTRRFMLVSKHVPHSSGQVPAFTYAYDDHDLLVSMMPIMIQAGAISEIPFEDVPTYAFTEAFVVFATGAG